MIEPDTGDWTWVIDCRCPDCGFDASTCDAGAVAALVRENAGAWRSLLAGGRIQSGRADPSRWSLAGVRLPRP